MYNFKYNNYAYRRVNMECRHCSSNQSIKLASKIFCANCGLPQEDNITNTVPAIANTPTNSTLTQSIPMGSNPSLYGNASALPASNPTNISQNTTSQTAMDTSLTVNSGTVSAVSTNHPPAVNNVSPTNVASKQQSANIAKETLPSSEANIKTGGILSKIFRKKKSSGITPEAIDAVFANIDKNKDNNQTNTGLTTMPAADGLNLNSPTTNTEQDGGLGLSGQATATITDHSITDSNLSLATNQNSHFDTNSSSIPAAHKAQNSTQPIIKNEAPIGDNTKGTSPFVAANNLLPKDDNQKSFSMDLSPNNSNNTSPATNTYTQPVATKIDEKSDSLKDLVDTISRVDDIAMSKNTTIDLRSTLDPSATDGFTNNDEAKTMHHTTESASVSSTQDSGTGQNHKSQNDKDTITTESSPLDLSKVVIEEAPNASNDLSAKSILTSFKPANVALSIIGIIILGIYIWQVNYSSIALRFAASKSGLSANVPGYIPTGWQLSNKFQAEPGRLTFSLVSPDSKSSIAINQVKSNWNTQDLLENFVLAKSDSYLALQSQGTTIYIYGKSQASWVEDGKWYRIEGDNNLSHDDLVKLASSI